MGLSGIHGKSRSISVLVDNYSISSFDKGNKNGIYEIQGIQEALGIPSEMGK
jgi:hypothetical protein